MKIVFIPYSYEYYGASESFLDLIKTLADNYNVEPVILTSKYGRYNEFAKVNNFENYVIGHKAFLLSKGRSKVRKIIKFFLRPFYWGQYRISNVTAIMRAEKYVDFSSVDIIHTNLNRNDIGAILAQKHGIRHIWHIREFGDADYECVSLRNNYIDFMNRENNTLIAISDAVMNKWILQGINKERIVRIYNGVDESKFFPIQRQDKQLVRIVMIGALHPTKGQILLLKAISNLPIEVKNRLRVDIYGDGKWDYKIRLFSLVKKKELSNIVTFKGYRDNICDIIKDYDVGVMASKAEAFGRVTVEYMMSGLLVIASNTGASMEIIRNGETGLIFEYPSVEALSKCIEYVVNNRKIISEIGNRACEDAKSRFSLSSTAKCVYSLYGKVING
ncbi:MAG: glycosyltransferase family 4 protein [Butyrivibrio sp.]|uniref:glycosyltransferase family 4 protein n=1 Tax=Butyrivibrio sp. TaxID=28121 RepID=UPI0025C55843|nr:glycosyltransferase family 4 protein [Butyrivibrio sp.]MBQ6587459.1 glycosyltransferase family 4 protein [Butyrivibrio sp.]